MGLFTKFLLFDKFDKKPDNKEIKKISLLSVFLSNLSKCKNLSEKTFCIAFPIFRCCNFFAFPILLEPNFRLKGGGNIQSLFEKKFFFFGNTPPGGKKMRKIDCAHRRKLKMLP